MSATSHVSINTVVLAVAVFKAEYSKPRKMPNSEKRRKSKNFPLHGEQGMHVNTLDWDQT